MYKKVILLFSLLFIFGCKRDSNSNFGVDSILSSSSVKLNPSGQTVMERVPAPDGYTWIEEESNSFGYYLQNLPVKEDGSAVLYYNGHPIESQSAYIAAVDLDIGDKDLQQCADVIIRLRADYLKEQGRENEIGFHFTSGHLFTWDEYKNGIRPTITNGNQVDFNQTATYDDSLEAYRKYMDIIYMYAGTISIDKETRKVTHNDDIKTGDFLNTAGSPGHAVFIIGSAQNSNGDKIYLLAEGFTPAQSIAVMVNPNDNSLNPWYQLDISDDLTKTARYHFPDTNIRSYD